MEPPLFKVSYCDWQEKNLHQSLRKNQGSRGHAELLVHCTVEAVERDGDLVSRS